MKGIVKSLVIGFIIIVLVGCNNSRNDEARKYQIIKEIKSNIESPFYIDFNNYPEDRKGLPVGVFDSGTGGLTVLNSILKLDKFNNETHKEGSDGVPDFVSEKFIYLADEANMPYGKYNAEGNSELLKEHIIKDLGFLLGNKYYDNPDNIKHVDEKEPVKAVVIACNTATAYGLELLNETKREWGIDIEIMGIIEAGSRSVVNSLVPESGRDVIGVLATEGTSDSGGYPMSIEKNYEKRFRNKDVIIVQQAGVGLAGAIDGDINYIDPLANVVRDQDVYLGPGLNNVDFPIDFYLDKEYGFDSGNSLLIERDSTGKILCVQLNSVENYIKYCVTHLVINTMRDYPERKIRSIILGCTHYPYVEKEIVAQLIHLKNLDYRYYELISNDIFLVDPAESLAKELYRHFIKEDLFGSDKNENSEFYISIPNPLLEENLIDEFGEFPYQYKYGRSINTLFQFVKRVPFSTEWIDMAIFDRLKQDVPYVFELIK